MADKKGSFIIDESVSKQIREQIADKAQKRIEQMKSEVSEREPILRKRQDFFEGLHHKWTNVQGQAVKQVEGHILVVINYIGRFCQKLYQAITNTPPKIKIISRDESNDIETSRAEAVEEAIREVLKKNNFWEVIFKRCTVNQIRDGDFTLDCKVMENPDGKKEIVIKSSEDLTKLMIGWDDASGSSFSFAVWSDLISTDKVMRDFGYKAEPISETNIETDKKGDHIRDQYGIFAGSSGTASTVPSGKSGVPKTRLTDYWGYEVIDGKVRVVNLIFIGKENVQFVATDYKKIPRFVGHSMLVAGKPWSMSFIDPLIDPQIELNDRTGEEGDMVRIGSHTKFLAINMPDFNPETLKPGSGQVIFIEGEGADFRPLTNNTSIFPSEGYLNRTMEHMFTLGIPKIGLAAGTAPYTGKVGAIQYQPIMDLVTDFRIQWQVVLKDLMITIQEYFIDYFPELDPIMREHLFNSDTGEMSEGQPTVRDVEFDWENILPLSRSDRVVDASTMRDRGAISLHSYLEEAGFRNPTKEIKKLKKEANDKDLMVLLSKFNQFSPGVVKAQLEAQKEATSAQEDNAALVGSMQAANQPTPSSNPPILNNSQNDGRRGVMSGSGTPTGQTATLKGAANQVVQNQNAQAGV